MLRLYRSEVIVILKQKNPGVVQTPAQGTIRSSQREDSANVSHAIYHDNSASSQRQRILSWLQSGRSLTTLQARHLLDSMHPSQRILELRRLGHNIDMAWVTDVTPEGHLHRVGRYTLHPPKQMSIFDVGGVRLTVTTEEQQ